MASANAMDGTDLILGEDYQALTISFDARETTVLAVRKKNNYLNLMKKKEEAEKGWLFFTSDSANISRLTEATGFRYKPTGNDFIHAATLIILTPDGKITRYMNGIYFLPFELKDVHHRCQQREIGSHHQPGAAVLLLTGSRRAKICAEHYQGFCDTDYLSGTGSVSCTSIFQKKKNCITYDITNHREKGL